MKLTLNLLSEERKKEIDNKKTFLKIINQSLLFLLPLVCLVMIFLSVYFALRINSLGQDNTMKNNQDQDSYKKLKNYEDNFSMVNSKVENLLKIESGHLFWSNVLKNLDAAVPNNIYISEIISKDYQVSLAGKAKTRDDFLKFQDNLKNSQCFSNVNAPLSDLMSKEDVDFEIDLDVQSGCLRSNGN